MKRYHYSRTYKNRGGGLPIFGLLFFAFITYMLFRIIGGLYSFLWTFIPIMLILALIINRRAITRYINRIQSRFKESALSGMIFLGLSILGLPFVSAYLLVNAIGTRGRDRGIEPDTYGKDYIPYEEVRENSKRGQQKNSSDEEFLDLPPLEEIQRQTDDDSRYI